MCLMFAFAEKFHRALLSVHGSLWAVVRVCRVEASIGIESEQQERQSKGSGVGANQCGSGDDSIEGVLGQ